jgi:hypothetical protein
MENPEADRQQIIYFMMQKDCPWQFPQNTGYATNKTVKLDQN